MLGSLAALALQLAYMLAAGVLLGLLLVWLIGGRRQ